MAGKKAVVIVLDGVGAGNAPDADKYGDRGSNTLGNLARAVGGLHLPNLEKMGLGNITAIDGVDETDAAIAAFGALQEKSFGKDSTSGHWELMGLVVEHPFPTYPHGFPPDVIEPFERAIGRGVLGNIAASGTAIIDELGEKHLATGQPIVYTSADSVFQIAAHKDIVPLKQLYEWCRIAREKILVGKHSVGRVIARPFIGEPGAFQRTPERRDFSVKPFGKTVLNIAKESRLPVLGIGKIEDLFAGSGLTEAIHTSGNTEGIEVTIRAIAEQDSGLIFTNLVDFDMLYGHRNDCGGFAAALREFDAALPDIIASLYPNDVLAITADHGNDPTTPSTDHSRERVPIIFYGNIIKPVNLGVRESFADLGATVSAHLGIAAPAYGKSFYDIVSGV